MKHVLLRWTIIYSYLFCADIHIFNGIFRDSGDILLLEKQVVGSPFANPYDNSIAFKEQTPTFREIDSLVRGGGYSTFSQYEVWFYFSLPFRTVLYSFIHLFPARFPHQENSDV